MKLPHDLSGDDLARALAVLGFGALAGIVADAAAHLEMGRQELLNRLFG